MRNKKRGDKKIKNKKNTVQKWLPIEEIFNNGIIKTKEKEYIKIIKIIPINFSLKASLEKEAILNSYKIFLKTCNFNIQILIQSKKEDLSKHISIIKNNQNLNKENLKNKYIQYIYEKNKSSKSASKNYFIIIKEMEESSKKGYKEKQYYFDKLNEKYFKIKECLLRCGNQVYEIKRKEETKKLLKAFLKERENILKTF